MRDPFEVNKTVLDPVEEQTIDALERQLLALRHVRLRVDSVVADIPAAALDGWRGLASVTFEWQLRELNQDVGTAASLVHAAISETTHALASLRGWG